MEWVTTALRQAEDMLQKAEAHAALMDEYYKAAQQAHDDADDRVKQLDEVIRNLSALLVPCAESRVPL